jgi:hypothetical protein
MSPPRPEPHRPTNRATLGATSNQGGSMGERAAAGEHRFGERSQLVSPDNRGDGFAGASGGNPAA